jgi:hypothetical protein
VEVALADQQEVAAAVALEADKRGKMREERGKRNKVK